MSTVQIQSASAQHTGGTTTTTLSTSIAAGGSSTPSMIANSPLDETFTRRLIEAVKAEPCLYNPNHEHYGNKHSSAQYRIQIWQKLRTELGFKDDAHALQMQWKRIRDRYVRERRKRRNASSGESSQDSSANGRERHASGGSNCSTSSTNVNTSPTTRQFTEMMRWIEPYLVDNMTNNSLHCQSAAGATAVTSSASQHLNVSQQPKSNQGQNGAGAMAVISSTAVSSDAGTYFVHQNRNTKQETAVCNQESTDSTSVSGYQQSRQPRLVTVQTSREYNTSRGQRLPNGANVGGAASGGGGGGGRSATNTVVSTSATGFTFRPNLYNGSPCSSTTSSEIDVGTSTTTTSYSGVQQVLMQQQQQQQQPQQQHQRQNLNQQSSTTSVVLSAVQSQQTTSPPQQQHSTPIVLAKTDQRSRLGQQLQTADGGVVTVTARGMAPVTGVIKKDVNVRTTDGGTVTMVIDPTTFYQHGSQKMYRLVNVSELSADALSGNNVSCVSTVGGELKIVGIPQRRKRVAAVSVQGMPNGRGQLGDDVVLDDGISEKTITIDQGTIPGNERIILDQRPSTGVANTSTVLGHNVHQLQLQHPSSSQAHPGISVSSHPSSVSSVPLTAQMGLPQTSSVPLRQHQQQTGGQRFITQTIPVEHPHYTMVPGNSSIHEDHFDPLEFANSIANHLSRLNDDEKAVAKMNIQRILMDARFGIGACARMIHDEELNEAAAAAVVSTTASHEISVAQRQSQQQQQPQHSHSDGPSRRIN